MYFEEFSLGQKFYLKPVRIEEEEIFIFARSYDPQAIHIDPGFAQEGHFKGIIASGFHTLCAVWRQWIDLGVFGREIIAGMSLDELVWTAPVRPDDWLSGEVEVINLISVKKQRGIVLLRFIIGNQAGEVMRMKVRAMTQSKPSGEED